MTNSVERLVRNTTLPQSHQSRIRYGCHVLYATSFAERCPMLSCREAHLSLENLRRKYYSIFEASTKAHNQGETRTSATTSIEERVEPDINLQVWNEGGRYEISTYRHALGDPVSTHACKSAPQKRSPSRMILSESSSSRTSLASPESS